MRRSDIADIKFLLWLIVACTVARTDDDQWLAIGAGLLAMYHLCESLYWFYKKD